MTSRFGNPEVLRRLGVSDPQVYDTGSVVPTMQVLDLSHSVASEPLEARGYIARYIASAALATWELVSGAPGGIIVEHLMASEKSGAFPSFTTLSTSPVRLTSAASGGPAVDIGGIPTRSRWGLSASVAAVPGPTQTFPFIYFGGVGGSNSPVFLPFRIYLASGASLVLQTVSTDILIACVFRELQDWQPT